MNIQDRTRLNTIIGQANKLLSSGAQVGPLVRNIDVLEALLDDVTRAVRSENPRELARLIELDQKDRAARE